MRRVAVSGRKPRRFLPRFSLFIVATILCITLWYLFSFFYLESSERQAYKVKMPVWQHPALNDLYRWLDSFPDKLITEDIGETLLFYDELCVSSEPRDVVHSIRVGMAHLHDFHPFEAMRAFRKGLRKGGKCCSLYWGMALALEYNKGFTTASNQLKQIGHEFCSAKETSPKNQIYFQAMAQSSGGRRIELLSDLVIEYTKDPESKLFLAWELISNSTQYMQAPEPQARLRAVKLLETVLLDYPNNTGANHYWIHAWEDSLYPELALPNAKILPLYGSRGSHFVHMPGHIYHRLGKYNRAAEAFKEAFKVDVAYLSSQGLTGRYHWEYLHNAAYYADMLVCAGRIEEAINVSITAADVDNLQIISTDKHFPLNADPSLSTSVGHYFYQSARSVPFVHVRLGKWNAASNSLMPIIEDIQQLDHVEEMRVGILYLRTLAHYFVLRGAISSYQCEKYAKDSKILLNMIDALREHVGSSFYLDVNVDVLVVWENELQALYQAYCENNFEYALMLMEEVIFLETQLPFAEPPPFPYPALISKGDIYSILALQEDDELIYKERAASTYLEVLYREPNYPLAHYKAATMFRSFDENAAKEHYKAFVEGWPEASKKHNMVTNGFSYFPNPNTTQYATADSFIRNS